MPTTLITSYGEFDAAIDRVLALAERRIDLFDHDLARFKLDQPARQAALKRVLAMPSHRLRIVVQNSQMVSTRYPLLMRLLETHSAQFSLIEADERLAHLSDAMLIADEQHGLIQFHREQPRGKRVENDEEEIKPYARKFQSIIDEGGTPISPRVAGL